MRKLNCSSVGLCSAIKLLYQCGKSNATELRTKQALGTNDFHIHHIWHSSSDENPCESNTQVARSNFNLLLSLFALCFVILYVFAVMLLKWKLIFLSNNLITTLTLNRESSVRADDTQIRWHFVCIPSIVCMCNVSLPAVAVSHNYLEDRDKILWILRVLGVEWLSTQKNCSFFSLHYIVCIASTEESGKLKLIFCCSQLFSSYC